MAGALCLRLVTASFHRSSRRVKHDPQKGKLCEEDETAVAVADGEIGGKWVVDISGSCSSMLLFLRRPLRMFVDVIMVGEEEVVSDESSKDDNGDGVIHAGCSIGSICS